MGAFINYSITTENSNTMEGRDDENKFSEYSAENDSSSEDDNDNRRTSSPDVREISIKEKCSFFFEAITEDRNKWKKIKRDEDKLKFYALAMQAIKGEFKGKGRWNGEGKEYIDAWNVLTGYPMEDAQQDFLEFVSKLQDRYRLL